MSGTHIPKLLIVAGVLTALASTACKNNNGGGGGGIIIQAGDSTPPEATLQLVHAAEKSSLVPPAVSPGTTLMLSSRTGDLDLSVSAKDSESGIQDIQFWVNTKTTTCDATGICSTSGPGLLGAPRFAYPSPATKTPGDVVAAQAFDLEQIDLGNEIKGTAPVGGTYDYEIIVYAVIINYDGLKSQTPELSATWHEAG